MNDKKVLELIFVGFDSMENRNPVYEESLGLFVNQSDKSAKDKIEELLSKRNNKLYLGYDNKVYPQYKIIRRNLL